MEKRIYLRVAAVAAVLLFAGIANGAGPGANAESAIPTFRVTTAEVHVSFTAIREKSGPVRDLSTADLQVLRDGVEVSEILSLESVDDVSLSALVMTDVSDSMRHGLSMERQAAEWLRSNSTGLRDHLSFIDFGADIESGHQYTNPHLTSLYDALWETMPRLLSYGAGRRSLILFTDGGDNYSLHSLNEVIAAAQRYDVALYAVTAHPNKKQSYRPDVLQALCEQTGGRYYDVRKPNQMQAAMAEILRELRNGFELVFRPGTVSPGLHQITIRPRLNRMHFFYRSAYYQPIVAAGEIAHAR